MAANGCKWLNMAEKTAEKFENGSIMLQQYKIDGRQYTMKCHQSKNNTKTEMSPKLKCYQNKIRLFYYFVGTIRVLH